MTPSAPKSPPPASGAQAEADFPEDPRFRTMRRLVNALLAVLIAGVLVIVIAVALRLKADLAEKGFVERSPEERVAAVEATADRIAITLRHETTGSERIVVLDGRTFRLIGEVAAD